MAFRRKQNTGGGGNTHPDFLLVFHCLFVCLHQFLGFKESLEMTHLPGAHDQQNAGLSERPPEDSGVCALTRLTESLLPIPLVVLLLGDLFNLVEELSDAQLELRQLLFLS